MSTNLSKYRYQNLLDNTQGTTSQNTKTFKLQKGEFKYSEIQPIENRGHEIFAKFYFSPTQTLLKRFGF